MKLSGICFILEMTWNHDRGMSEECLGAFVPVYIFQLPLRPVCLNASLDSRCLEVSLSLKEQTDAHTHSFTWDHGLIFKCPPKLEISSFIPATTAGCPSPYTHVGSRDHYAVGEAPRCPLKHWPVSPTKSNGNASECEWLNQRQNHECAPLHIDVNDLKSRWSFRDVATCFH